MAAPLSLTDVLAQLRDVRPHGDNYQAKCPAHEDGTASLSVSVGGGGRILLKCFAGCSFGAICDALGIKQSQLMPAKEYPRSVAPASVKSRIVATYDYRDVKGAILYQSVRYVPKHFTQRRPDGTGGWIHNMQGVERVPYRLNELKGHSRIYIVEGEKDADACWTNGRAATTNVGGAGKWRTSDSAILKTIGVEHCLLVADNDDPGRKHMLAVEASLKQVGIKATRVDLHELPIKSDLSDWLASGRTLAQIDERASKKPFTLPPDVPSLNISIDPHGAGTWKHTDLGAAESLVSRFGDKIRFNHKHKEWLIWNCHHWKVDKNEEIRRKAHEHARLWQTEATQIGDYELKTQTLKFTLGLEKVARLGALTDMARAMLPVADTGHGWDDQPFLVGCPNGVIDVQIGALRDGAPLDKITLQTGVPFAPDATCPRWVEFLGQIFEEKPELVPFVQRAAGYSLTGDTREQCFFMLVGHGANGKSTFLSVLAHIWADYAYTTDTNVFANSATSRDSTPFDLAELAGRRLVLMSETKTNSQMNEQSVKGFTGGEKINAQKKFGHPFEFQPVGKLWMGVNHRPRVKDDSYGFWRRVRLIPFEQTFNGSRDNRKLKAELIAEAPGILAWAVEGARIWLENGLEPPTCVLDATTDYQDDQDPLKDYISERTALDVGHEVSCTATYLNYRDWAREQGMGDREIMGRRAFSNLMAKRFERKHTSSGDRYVGLRVTVRAKDMLSSYES